MAKKPTMTIKLEEARDLPEHVQSELGRSSGLVIKQIASNSPARVSRRLARNDSYMAEVDETLSALDKKSIIERLSSHF